MEKIVCPHCERKLRNIKAWHYCKKVDIDELFVDKPDEIVLVFDAIMQQVSQWENVEASATKNCIVFVRNKTFLVLKPMKKFLEAKFHSDMPLDDERLHKTTMWNKRHEGVFRFENEQQLSNHFFQYVKNSYLIS